MIEHFIAGFLLSLLGLIWWPLYSLGLIAGVAMEIWDSYGHGEVSMFDVLATWAGVGITILIANRRNK